jgi:asparagine synthase (glutamine-hydrolysing)
VFASSLDALAAYPGVTRELAHQALFDYLFYHASPGPDTVFQGQKRVPPGHFVEYTDASAQEPAAYWSLRFNETPGRPLEALKSQFRELVLAAVTESAGASQAGAFLSGGTDSSTVSGMLARLGSKPAKTFSIGFDVAGYDEMSYARIAARHFQCEHHEYYVTPDDVVDALPRIAASYDQPFGNASAVPTYYCARLAREHGVTRLLAGDGGDELFGGNERYAKQHLYSLYSDLPAFLRSIIVPRVPEEKAVPQVSVSPQVVPAAARTETMIRRVFILESPFCSCPPRSSSLYVASACHKALSSARLSLSEPAGR